MTRPSLPASQPCPSYFFSRNQLLSASNADSDLRRCARALVYVRNLADLALRLSLLVALLFCFLNADHSNDLPAAIAHRFGCLRRIRVDNRDRWYARVSPRMHFVNTRCLLSAWSFVCRVHAV